MDSGAILQRIEGFNYNVHPFWIQIQEMDLTEITYFYNQCYKHQLKPSRLEIPKQWVLEVPLFHNPVVHGTLMSSRSVEGNKLRRNCTKLKALVNIDGWKSVEVIMYLKGL